MFYKIILRNCKKIFSDTKNIFFCPAICGAKKLIKIIFYNTLEIVKRYKTNSKNSVEVFNAYSPQIILKVSIFSLRLFAFCITKIETGQIAYFMISYKYEKNNNIGRKKCPKCGKNRSETQRCKCKECNIIYTITPKKREYSEETK